MAKKQTTVTIVGSPNAGKSTLLNAILKSKVAITSYKPQTTRNQIQAVYEDEKLKITFIDTPGYHTVRNKLDLFLNSEIKASFKRSDIVLFLVDSTAKIGEEEIKLAKIISGYNPSKTVIIFTKKDVTKNCKIDDKLKQLDFDNHVMTKYMTSKDPNDVAELLKNIYDLIDDSMVSILANEKGDDFFISEIIREQLLLNMKKEVPHSTAVIIEGKEFDKEKNMFTINAAIIVEKESQKPIIIGAKGQMIKKIGTNSRMELLKVFDCKINLKLFVKVEKNWRNSDIVLKSLGYTNK